MWAVLNVLPVPTVPARVCCRTGLEYTVVESAATYLTTPAHAAAGGRSGGGGVAVSHVAYSRFLNASTTTDVTTGVITPRMAWSRIFRVFKGV